MKLRPVGLGVRRRPRPNPTFNERVNLGDLSKGRKLSRMTSPFAGLALACFSSRTLFSGRNGQGAEISSREARARVPPPLLKHSFAPPRSPRPCSLRVKSCEFGRDRVRREVKECFRRSLCLELSSLTRLPPSLPSLRLCLLSLPPSLPIPLPLDAVALLLRRPRHPWPLIAQRQKQG